MKLLISLSKGFEVGSRVAAEFDKNDWACGTVLKVTPTGYRVDFDYGEEKLLKTADVRFLPIGPKKFKKGLTLAQVKALKPAATAKPAKVAAAKPAAKPVKAAKPTKAKPAPAPKAEKPVKAKPATPASSPASAKTPKKFVGSVVKSRFGDVVILSFKLGRKYVEFKWATVSGKPVTGWLKLPMNMGDDYAFSRYPFVRMATPEEMHGGKGALQAVEEAKWQRKSDALDSIHNQQIKPGDIVKVQYRNGTKEEIVLDVDYRAAKLAIVRQYSSAAEGYSKRRLLPVKFCTKVADGGGSFDPNNKLYVEHGLHVPDFYKRGNVVAPRKARAQRGDFDWLLK